jgi:hypothetical protein
MKTLFLIALSLAVASLAAGCNHVYAPEDGFAEHGPYYGETPAYFDHPQPGLGGKADPND